MNSRHGRIQGEGAGGVHPPPPRWSFLLRIYVLVFKNFLPHRQWRHSLEVPPWYSDKVYLIFQVSLEMAKPRLAVEYYTQEEMVTIALW